MAATAGDVFWTSTFEKVRELADVEVAKASSNLRDPFGPELLERERFKVCDFEPELSGRCAQEAATLFEGLAKSPHISASTLGSDFAENKLINDPYLQAVLKIGLLQNASSNDCDPKAADVGQNSKSTTRVVNLARRMLEQPLPSTLPSAVLSKGTCPSNAGIEADSAASGTQMKKAVVDDDLGKVDEQGPGEVAPAKEPARTVAFEQFRLEDIPREEIQRRLNRGEVAPRDEWIPSAGGPGSKDFKRKRISRPEWHARQLFGLQLKEKGLKAFTDGDLEAADTFFTQGIHLLELYEIAKSEAEISGGKSLSEALAATEVTDAVAATKAEATPSYQGKESEKSDERNQADQDQWELEKLLFSFRKNKAAVCLKIGHYRAAIECCNNALADNARDSHMKFLRGRAYTELGCYDTAAEDLEGIVRDPFAEDRHKAAASHMLTRLAADMKKNSSKLRRLIGVSPSTPMTSYESALHQLWLEEARADKADKADKAGKADKASGMDSNAPLTSPSTSTTAKAMERGESGPRDTPTDTAESYRDTATSGTSKPWQWSENTASRLKPEIESKDLINLLKELLICYQSPAVRRKLEQVRLQVDFDERKTIKKYRQILPEHVLPIFRRYLKPETLRSDCIDNATAAEMGDSADSIVEVRNDGNEEPTSPTTSAYDDHLRRFNKAVAYYQHAPSVEDDTRSQVKDLIRVLRETLLGDTQDLD